MNTSQNEAMEAAPSSANGANADLNASIEKKQDPTDHGKIDIEASPNEEIYNEFSGSGGENFRNMSRWDTICALITNQLGLGFLSLPGALRTLGIIPGLIALLGVGFISWYTGFVLYQFYCRYPHLLNMVDMVTVMGGTPGTIIASIIVILQLLFACASSAVTLSIIFNTISQHSICTLGFVGISALLIWAFCLPRTAKFVSQSGIPCFLSIIVASLIVVISVGLKGPFQAPEDFKVKIVLVGNPTFHEVVNAILRMIFAFAGNIAYVSYMAEMQNPTRDFAYGLSWLFGSSIFLYSSTAIAIYCLAGDYTVSPGLGTAPIVYAKAAYGIIIPAVLTTGLANGHVGIKYIYTELMRKLNLRHEIPANSVKSWSAWVGCATAFWVLCFVISNAIPMFDSILSITSCLCYSWTGWGVSGFFWLHMNKGTWFDGWKKRAFFCLNIVIIGMACFLMVAGMCASVTELLDIFKKGTGVRGPFDCGDNSYF